MATAALALGSMGAGIVSGILERRAAKKAAEQAAAARANAAQNITANYGTIARDVGAASGTAQQQIGTGTADANNTLANVNQGIQANLQPYMAAGVTGIGTTATGVNTLTNLAQRPEFRYEDYASGPAHDFLMREGSRAIENSASARGIAQSGNTLKDLTQYGQDLAATHYQQAFDRYNQGVRNQLDIGRTISDVGLRQTDTGLRGTQTASNVASDLGQQQAANTLGAGYGQAGITTNTAQYLGNLGTRAGETANMLNVGGADITAAGTIGQGSANVGMVNNTANNLPALVAAILGRRKPGGAAAIDPN